MVGTLSRLIIFQTLRGHHGSALSHITSGVKILSEVRDGAEGRPTHGSLTVSAHPYVGLESLEVLFNRLNTQVAQVNLPRNISQSRKLSRCTNKYIH